MIITRGSQDGVTFKVESEKDKEFELIYDGKKKKTKLMNTFSFYCA